MYCSKRSSLLPAGVERGEAHHQKNRSQHLICYCDQSGFVSNSLVYSGLCGRSASVQPDVDDPPAEVLVPGHHVHPVAHLYTCRTETINKRKVVQ